MTSVTMILCRVQSAKGAIWAEFYGRMSTESLAFPLHEVKDPVVKLQLISLQDKGSGALSPEKSAHVRPPHACRRHFNSPGLHLVQEVERVGW